MQVHRSEAARRPTETSQRTGRMTVQPLGMLPGSLQTPAVRRRALQMARLLPVLRPMALLQPPRGEEVGRRAAAFRQASFLS